MKKLLPALLLTTLLAANAYAIEDIRYKTPSAGVLSKTVSAGVVNNSGGTFTPTQLAGLKLWLDPSDTSTITAYAEFTLDNGSASTISIQCKQNVMPTSINFISDLNPNGASYDPVSRVMTVETNQEPTSFPASSIAADISALSGYTAVLTGVDDDGADSISVGSMYVVQIDDKSGNGNNAVQATQAQRPTTGEATVNGRNVISFHGIASSQWLKILSMSCTPNTVAVVFKNDASTWDEYDGVFSARSSTSTKVSNSTVTSGVAGVFGTNKVSGFGQVSDSAFVDGAAGTSTDFDSFAIGVAASPLTSPHLVLYTDNVGASTQNYAVGADVFGAVGLRHMDGDIAEIIVADTAISDNQRVKLTTREKIYWGIS